MILSRSFAGLRRAGSAASAESHESIRKFSALDQLRKFAEAEWYFFPIRNVCANLLTTSGVGRVIVFAVDRITRLLRRLLAIPEAIA